MLAPPSRLTPAAPVPRATVGETPRQAGGLAQPLGLRPLALPLRMPGPKGPWGTPRAAGAQPRRAADASWPGHATFGVRPFLFLARPWRRLDLVPEPLLLGGGLRCTFFLPAALLRLPAERTPAVSAPLCARTPVRRGVLPDTHAQPTERWGARPARATDSTAVCSSDSKPARASHRVGTDLDDHGHGDAHRQPCALCGLTREGLSRET